MANIDVNQLPLDLGDEIARLMRRYYPILVSRAFGDAEGLVGTTIAFDLDSPRVQEVLKELAKQVTNIAETTRDEIRALVGQQAENGWSLAELADAIRAHGTTISESRAMTIAQTETAAAYSKGSLLAYESSGVVKQTEWLVSDPCPICAPLAGMKVDLNADFADGISHPPAHPKCKCALAPVVE